jgi:hypothetical protein
VYLCTTGGQIDLTRQHTVAWADPRQRRDGKWAFAHPETQNEAARDGALLTELVRGLGGAAEEEAADWWPAEDL